MEGKTMKRDKEQYLSWEEFKQEYLSEVERLAEILGVNRYETIKNYKGSDDAKDDDYKFVDEIMCCISECENKTERQGLLRKLKEAEGAKDIFDEIYRIWMFGSHLDSAPLFKKIPGYGGERSEPGKGEIVQIFLIDDHYGNTIINPTVGEDYADCQFPVVVKVKPNSDITNKDLIRALRDLADSLEADFRNCYLPSSDGYVVPSHKEVQAILCGLSKNNAELYQVVKWHPGGPLEEAIKKAGWLDPNVSLDTGIGELLQKGWPELYENVLAGKMSPFEALVETGWVHPKDVYEACTN
jgi:hypothetical protein